MKKWFGEVNFVEGLMNIIISSRDDNLSFFPDKCPDLPDIWSIKTNSPLPVDYGTRVEISCIPGYSLAGSSLITCIKDRNWEYDITPKCILG